MPLRWQSTSRVGGGSALVVRQHSRFHFMNIKSKSTRFWLIACAVVIAAIVFRQTFGSLLFGVVFWVLFLAALFILPAIIGAIAGSSIRDFIFWMRVRRHRRQVSKYDHAA